MALDARTTPTGPSTDLTTAGHPVAVPGLKIEPGLFESYRIARRNVLELIPERAYHEPMLTGGKRPGWVMVVDPAALERVLKDRVEAYPKNAILKRLMQPRRGSNLIISEGEAWRRQRRVLAPVFAKRALADAAPAMTRAAEDALVRVEDARAADPSAPIDMFPQMAAATCDVICDLVLSGRDAVDREQLRRSVDAFVASQGRISLFDILGVPNWVPRPFALTDRSRVRMDRLADQIITARTDRGPSDPPDLLDLMIAGHTEEADPHEVRNNLLAFLFAGHETTAIALTWALYLLAFAPQVQAALRSEVRTVLGDRPAAEEGDLEALDLTGRVIEEALRLYAPAGFLTRVALEDDDLGGVPVRAGMTVILPIHALHRHRLLWDAPDAFDPDRFLPEQVARRHRYAHLPFGGGPKVCIGAALARQEARILLATLVARYHMALPQGFTPKPQMWFTLRAAGGMPLILTRN